MAIFFVAATCAGTGESLDLFTVAATPQDAIEMWRDYYEDSDIMPDKVFRVPSYGESFAMGNPRPLAWGTDVKQVWPD